MLGIQSDGRVSDDIRDPPGQQSVYIPSGNVREERYRLSTLAHFPVSSPISKIGLARSGFYYTGYYDRVKCFACGRTVERWESSDNPSDVRWHKQGCPLQRGLECGNIPSESRFQLSSAIRNGNQVHETRDPVTGSLIRRITYPSDLPERVRQQGGLFQVSPGGSVHIQNPPPRHNPSPSNTSSPGQPPRQWRMANVISADHRRFLSNLYLNRELDRLASFARWPAGRPNVSPTSLAKTGFFYLGDMDRTQCFSCGGVLRNWTSNDDAFAEHRSHFPQCKMVLGTETRNAPVPSRPESTEERESCFPCRFPSNPHMRSEAARLDTFDHRWPIGRTSATAAEISQAGFFFLGERDRVKCWYCNGGLQNWDYDDIPWVEHAKWFPNCQFLLRVKGQHYVHRHLSANAHLQRPIIPKQDGASIDPPSSEQGQSSRSPDIPPPSPRDNQPAATPTIIDPREEQRKQKERIQNIMKNSEIVKSVLLMGFDSKIVETLLEDRVASGNVSNPDDIYPSMSELLNDVMKKEEEMKEEEEDMRMAQATAASVAPTQAGPSSFGTYSSIYSNMTSGSNFSSLGPAPGSGKYNVSYIDNDDDDKMMDMDQQSKIGSETEVKGSATSHMETAASMLDTELMQEAIEKIEEESLCKICFFNKADMVFLPCSHMCCCMDCTQAIQQCPLCRKPIEKAIKTYVS